MADLPVGAQTEDSSAADFDEMARVFSALGNPIRLRVMRILAAQEGCYCGELVQELGMAQSTVSHHLKILKDAGLIKGTEQGTWVCYCVDREKLELLKQNIITFE